jgi:GPH family glycoside/pentoside/hexuronide:cation symporter
MGALVFMAFAFVATWWLYNPAYPWMLPISWGLIGGTCSSAFWMLYQSVTADVMDFDELNTGMRREGAFNACASWMIKAGYALGIGGSGVLIAATGFDAKLGAAQSAETVLWIRFLLPAMPVIGLLFAIFFVSRFPLTPARMEDIRQQLETRRGKI